jgi:hypothetical protein
MSIKTDVRTPENTLNYMKYVEIENDTRYPAVTGGSGQGVFNKSAILFQNINDYRGSGDGAGNFNLGTDSFGRMRTSEPFTLFDSSHRYADNNLFATTTSIAASSTFVQTQGLIDLEVGPLSGSKVYRETKKVFSYQPGKSLQNLNTFVFSPSSANLRQRVGYFGDDNGIYLELDGDELYMVQRTIVTGSITETKIPQSDWNYDKLDGTGPSGVTLDITKTQIQFIDIEWLGAGTARTGFVINGVFIACHYFHHANLVTSTYMTTGSLPVRYEIENLADTGSNHILKQICSTVISEGGYELGGFQQSISTPISAARTTSGSVGVFVPVASIRLKTTPNRLDAIVILTALSILGTGNSNNFNWQVIAGGTVNGGTWYSAGGNSSVDYNLTGTSLSGTDQKILASGYFSSTNQSSPNIDILKEALFKFQLERDTFTQTALPLSLMIACDNTSQGVFGSLDWEEVSR